MIEDAVQSILSADATLLALVFTNADGTKSIDWGSRTQGDQVPACFHVCDRCEQITIGGASATLQAEYTVYGIAFDAKSARDIANAAADALAAQENTVHAPESVSIGSVSINLREMDVPLATNGQDRDPCAVAFHLVILFKELD